MKTLDPYTALRQGYQQLTEQRHACKCVGGTDECIDRDDDPRYQAPPEWNESEYGDPDER